MSIPSVVIVGIGMTTSVGLSAAETAASIRSGTMRFIQSQYRDQRFDQFALAEVPDEGLAPLVPDLAKRPGMSTRETRMLRLATAPLAAALAPLGARDGEPPLSLCVALPENETTRPLDRSRFIAALARQCGGVFDPERSDATHMGRAGGLIAVGQGVTTIERGIAEFVIVGGIDTFVDLYVLGTLDMEKRVKSAVNLDGFVPGEGAAFLLLAHPRAAAARGLTSLGRVSPVAMGFETGHLYSPEPYRGEGLAATLHQLDAAGIPAPMEEVYSSMNGESHWSKEWGVGYLRNRRLISQDFRMHHPADCCGDTGAACGPMMVGLGALGIQGRYRRSPALVYGSSDRGGRAALIVSEA